MAKKKVPIKIFAQRKAIKEIFIDLIASESRKVYGGVEDTP